jgi:hypothetical protein
MFNLKKKVTQLEAQHNPSDSHKIRTIFLRCDNFKKEHLNDTTTFFLIGRWH